MPVVTISWSTQQDLPPDLPVANSVFVRLRISRIIACALLLALPAGRARADQPVPGNILDPQSPAEAWNVIRLATRNIDRLLAEQRLGEVPVQASYCSPALRALARLTAGEPTGPQIGSHSARALDGVNALARAAKSRQFADTTNALAGLRIELDALARHFDPAVVTAEIYFCAMHPDGAFEDGAPPCPKCGMKLFERRLPYSFIYTRPGAPTMRLTATTSGPLTAGRVATVKLRLAHADDSPVRPGDLLETHTERIHLLIEEPGLGDYHHEHPKPTEIAGEYSFSFTPRKTAPYRMWADLMPVTTGVQELPFTDLPSTGRSAPAPVVENRFLAAAGGYRFTLTLDGGNRLPLAAQQARRMGIAVADGAGRPVTQLEPVMNAFAHLVGFYGDHETVVHLHPTGGDILNPDLRGGPALGFIFFPPKPGFVRLYCQVRVDGKMIFAPFSLNVEPFCAPTSQ
jgi:Heavy metal binding domain